MSQLDEAEQRRRRAHRLSRAMVECYSEAVSDQLPDSARNNLAERLAKQLRQGIAISTDLGNYVGSVIRQWESEYGRAPGPTRFAIDMYDEVTVVEEPGRPTL